MTVRVSRVLELEIKNELLKAEVAHVKFASPTSAEYQSLYDRFCHLTEQHRLLNICACEEERKAKNWKYAYEELSTATEELRTENEELRNKMERNITHNRFVCAAYEKDMMELRDKAAASEIQARQFSAEVADLRIETKERWAALDTLREKHRELAALQATMQDINNGLRADLSQAHNACLEYRTHNTQLRKELDEANYKYEQLDFSVNESVKKSSAYKEVAAHVSELQQILHRLGVSYTLT